MEQNRKITTTTTVSNGVLSRETDIYATGKSGSNRISTNGSKLVSMQEAKRLVESKMVDLIDYVPTEFYQRGKLRRKH